MNRLCLGLLLGVVYGAFAILTMLKLSFPERRTALLGAFADRFAIGFLSAQVAMPMPPWAQGALVGLLVSLPSALLTKTYVPILVLGIVGGALCGGVVGHWAAS